MNPSLSTLVEQEVSINCSQVQLQGTLAIPSAPRGLVIFAHGSGSSRLSPRNRHVANIMHDHHLATLLFDLLTEEEAKVDEKTGELRFNIEFLSQRLLEATHWAKAEPALTNLEFGYFGSSTGAAAALVAASKAPEIGAIVSRGGRSDLADHVIAEVKAPTLFIVGENDPSVLEWNRNSAHQLQGESHVQIVPGATHLFAEAGTLEYVARHAAEWFDYHLGMGSPA